MFGVKTKMVQKQLIFQKKSLNDMTIVTSKNHKDKNLENLINKIGFREKIIMGSIGCKISSIIKR